MRGWMGGWAGEYGRVWGGGGETIGALCAAYDCFVGVRLSNLGGEYEIPIAYADDAIESKEIT